MKGMRYVLGCAAAAWIGLLNGCGGNPPPLEQVVQLSRPLAVAPAAITSTQYDGPSGILSLPGLVVASGGSSGCYDVALRTISTAPIRVELDSARPRTCDAGRVEPSHYDDATGLLRLPGLPVLQADGSGCYDVVLRKINDNPIRLELASAQGGAPCARGSAPVAESSSFSGSVVLGAVSDSSVQATVYSADRSGTVWIAYGIAPGVYNRQTAPVTLSAGQPRTLTLSGLITDLRYHYRLMFQPVGAAAGAGAESSFHTARPPGSRFTFTVQADSHMDENSDVPTYWRTLANVAADAPDFHIDLGDTFMTEKHALPLSATSPPAASAGDVDPRYAYEHGHFGRTMHAVPLFLVNGNHDGELGWLGNNTASSLPVWTTLARKRFFPAPPTGSFFRGDSQSEPFVGERAAWYAWQWGDALFVALDPYWNSGRVGGNSDAWNLTLGERQYRWLADTLKSSPARFKFIFLHNLVGGLDGQMRGGVEAAPYYEWGGRNADGSAGFAAKRPGWAQPIHPLLVQHGVTAVFHGHDHVYVKQMLDGIVYQAVPQPSARNFQSGANIARDYHYDSGTVVSSSGHLRVTVDASGVRSDYVRAWLPTQENAQRRNGQVDDSWQAAAAR